MDSLLSAPQGRPITWVAARSCCMGTEPFYIATSRVRGSSFSTSWPTLSISLIVAILVDMKYNNWCLIRFWFAFPWWLMTVSIFSCIYLKLIYFLWTNEVGCSEFLPSLKNWVSFFSLLSSLSSSLYTVLWIQILHPVCDLYIFSPSLWFVLSFSEQYILPNKSFTFW